MCNYHLLHYLCGHTSLWAGSNCYLLYAQLQRINDPLYYTAPYDSQVPFEIPRQCLPNRRNVLQRSVDECCGLVECANDRGGLYAQRYGCGVEGAQLGKRIGVGWRE
jgi:hypothetical protein